MSSPSPAVATRKRLSGRLFGPNSVQIDLRAPLRSLFRHHHQKLRKEIDMTEFIAPETGRETSKQMPCFTKR
ncbi:hypothetical protein N7501_003033 [Penicillium viridicatum]|nr:hypothetical protein N7501_003033 [Penicillium viridicatum]